MSLCATKVDELITKEEMASLGDKVYLPTALKSHK